MSYQDNSRNAAWPKKRNRLGKDERKRLEQGYAPVNEKERRYAANHPVSQQDRDRSRYEPSPPRAKQPASRPSYGRRSRSPDRSRGPGRDGYRSRDDSRGRYSPPRRAYYRSRSPMGPGRSDRRRDGPRDRFIRSRSRGRYSPPRRTDGRGRSPVGDGRSGQRRDGSRNRSHRSRSPPPPRRTNYRSKSPTRSGRSDRRRDGSDDRGRRPSSRRPSSVPRSGSSSPAHTRASKKQDALPSPRSNGISTSTDTAAPAEGSVETSLSATANADAATQSAEQKRKLITSYIHNQLRGRSFTSGDEWQSVSFGQTPSGPDAAEQLISIKGSIEIRFHNMNKRRTSPAASADAKRTKTARNLESENGRIDLGGESDPELPTMDVKTQEIRARTLDKLQASLERYEQEMEEGDQMAAHMFALLPRVIEKYNEHRYQDHQVFLSRDGAADNSHLPLDLYWDHIKVLSRSGGWINDSIIDTLFSTTPPPSGNMDFISPGNKFYQQFLGAEGSKEVLEEALASETLPPSGPSLKKNTDTMVGIWNPTNTHWVMFVASAAGEERSITLYDSCSRHSSTWKKTDMLPLVMELMGRFHHEFEGEWPRVIQQGKTIRQKAADCGPFSIYGARCILAGKKIEVHKKSKTFGRHLRTKYVGEIRALIQGDPFDQYDRFADAIWDANRDDSGDESSEDDSSSSDDTDEDGFGEERGDDATSAAGCDPDFNDPDDNSDSDNDDDEKPIVKGTPSEEFVMNDQDDIVLQDLLKKSTRRDRAASILGSNELTWHELSETHRVRSQTIERCLDVSARTVRRYHNAFASGLASISNANLVFKKRKKANVQYYRLNPRNTQYTPDPDTAGMFSTPQHVRVHADDIGHGYDLVVVFTRQSGPTHHAIEQGLDKHTMRANEIYSAWHSIFNRFNDEHELVEHEDQISDEGNFRMHVNLHLGSSNTPLFGSDSPARLSEVKSMKKILRAVSKVRKNPRVLLLQAGLDASTTDTDSFRKLINHAHFKGIEFSLTMVVPDFISNRYPQVFFSRHGNTAWGHWNVRKLVNVKKDGASTQLAREPSYARLILWLDRIYHGKQQKQNHIRDTTFSHAMYMTTHVKRSGFPVDSVDEKACEQCGASDTPEYWTRGDENSSTVICSREDCLTEQSQSTATANSGSTGDEDEDPVDSFSAHSSTSEDGDDDSPPTKRWNPRNAAGALEPICLLCGCNKTSQGQWYNAGKSNFFPEFSGKPGHICQQCYNDRKKHAHQCHQCSATKSYSWHKSLPGSIEVTKPVVERFWCQSCYRKAKRRVWRSEPEGPKAKKAAKVNKAAVEEEEDTD